MSEPQKSSFSLWLRSATENTIESIARRIAGVGPNTLTLIGVIVASVSGFFAARGQFALAALWIVLGTPFDALDGAVARVTGKASDFGALLDSTLDRYGEAATLTGVGVYMALNDNTLGLVLVFVALVGSVMVSYVRARSEGLNIENKVGLMTRVERILLTLLMLVAAQFYPPALMIGLWVLAVGAQFTVIQRVVEAYRVSHDG